MSRFFLSKVNTVLYCACLSIPCKRQTIVVTARGERSQESSSSRQLQCQADPPINVQGCWREKNEHAKGRKSPTKQPHCERGKKRLTPRRGLAASGPAHNRNSCNTSFTMRNRTSKNKSSIICWGKKTVSTVSKIVASTGSGVSLKPCVFGIKSNNATRPAQQKTVLRERSPKPIVLDPEWNHRETDLLDVPDSFACNGAVYQMQETHKEI